uniref:Uncharacterized protein n=1 Tax=Plectus sambesii TaxID=2011161 RepID=A0A914W2D7_9BILA
MPFCLAGLANRLYDRRSSDHHGRVLDPAELDWRLEPIARQRNAEIQTYIDQCKKEDSKVMKLLLLGGPASGKSTVCKQMQIIHKDGFQRPEQLDYYRILIHSNIMEIFRQLIDGCSQVEINLASLQKLIRRINRKFRLAVQEGGTLNPKLGQLLTAAWKSPQFQAVYHRHYEIDLLDSAKYWYGQLDRVCRLDFVPTPQDILRSRAPTTGIFVTTFQFKNARLKLVDVGGQKSQRRKWLHCFDDVKVVLFIVDLAGYAKKADEAEEQTNNLQAALKIFQDISTSRILKNAFLLLFLNKLDIFEELLEQVDLSECFPDYDGENYLDPAKHYIRELFLSVAPPKRGIFPYFTTATNTDNVEMVFQACMESVLKQSTKATGLA